MQSSFFTKFTRLRYIMSEKYDIGDRMITSANWGYSNNTYDYYYCLDDTKVNIANEDKPKYQYYSSSLVDYGLYLYLKEDDSVDNI